MRQTRSWVVRPHAWAVLAIALALSRDAERAVAQQPGVPSAPIAAYRPPALALVQPTDGGTVPQDQPIVVLRFAAGDSSDPIDARSFRVSVDGEDRTSLFQLARHEAWGPLARLPDANAALALGPHRLAARICSVRGACSEVSATVLVVTSAAAPQTNTAATRRRTLLDVLLAAARKLLTP